MYLFMESKKLSGTFENAGKYFLDLSKICFGSGIIGLLLSNEVSIIAFTFCSIVSVTGLIAGLVFISYGER